MTILDPVLGVVKAGAVAGIFIIPVLLRDGEPTTVLIVSIAVMAAGAIITALASKKISVPI